jgi:hypothetical protein
MTYVLKNSENVIENCRARLAELNFFCQAPNYVVKIARKTLPGPSDSTIGSMQKARHLQSFLHTKTIHMVYVRLSLGIYVHITATSPLDTNPYSAGLERPLCSNSCPPQLNVQLYCYLILNDMCNISVCYVHAVYNLIVCA